MDLMGKKYYFFALSLFIMILGVAGYIYHGGFNYDIQFKGGTVLEIQMSNNKFDANVIADDLSKTLNKRLTALKSSIENIKDNSKNMNFLIINVSGQYKLTDSEQNQVLKIVREKYKAKTDAQLMVRQIDPTIGNELKSRSLTAVFVSSILIILYIWFRFNIMSGLAAGVTAVAGLVHDILIMLVVYAVFNIPVNESFIAAILTIMGYSMNDTIIIYDRIRENSHLMKKTKISELVNKSIMQTLARSINTVVTVLICLVTVYAFAAKSNISSIKEFSLPLIIGVATGCYSSIFISSPLWVLWKEYKAKPKTA